MLVYRVVSRPRDKDRTAAIADTAKLCTERDEAALTLLRTLTGGTVEDEVPECWKETLEQMWPGWDSTWPPCAFKKLMLVVFCNSH